MRTAFVIQQLHNSISRANATRAQCGDHRQLLLRLLHEVLLRLSTGFQSRTNQTQRERIQRRGVFQTVDPL